MTDFLQATRSSYDTVAVEYADMTAEEFPANLWNRTVLTAFAEMVGGGRVADIGSGPGHVTAFLASLGLDVFGIDLSPASVEHARKIHPDVRFEVGTMTDLDIPDASLDGLSAYYSTIHVPDERLPRVFAEFHRVLKPGGYAFLAFQVGDEIGERTEAWGHEISLRFHRRPPERVAALLADAGLPVRARIVREPEVFPFLVEKTPHAYLFARRPEK